MEILMSITYAQVFRKWADFVKDVQRLASSRGREYAIYRLKNGDITIREYNEFSADELLLVAAPLEMKYSPAIESFSSSNPSRNFLFQDFTCDLDPGKQFLCRDRYYTEEI